MLFRSDAALSAALRAEVCDGVISGVACVAPELILGLYEKRSRAAEQALEELIAQLRLFPTPWGLKFLAQARSIFTASFPLPLSAERKAHGERVEQWFSPWIAGVKL